MEFEISGPKGFLDSFIDISWNDSLPRCRRRSPGDMAVSDPAQSHNDDEGRRKDKASIANAYGKRKPTELMEMLVIRHVQFRFAGAVCIFA